MKKRINKRKIDKSTKLIIVLLALIATLAVIAFVIFVVPRMLHNSPRSKDISMVNLREAHDKASAAIGEEIKNAKHSLVELNLLHDKRVVYESNVDQCKVSAEYKGWITDSWKQDCILQRSAIYMASQSSFEKIKKLVYDSDGMQEVFGLKTKSQAVCNVLYERENAPTLIFLPKDVDSSYLKSCDEARKALDAPLAQRGIVSTKVYDTFKLQDIDSSHSYLLIQVTKKYFEQNIGCANESSEERCLLPVKEPVMYVSE